MLGGPAPGGMGPDFPPQVHNGPPMRPGMGDPGSRLGGPDHRPPFHPMDMEVKQEGGGGMRRDPRDPRSRDPRDRGGSAGPRGPPQQQGPPHGGMRPGGGGGPPPPGARAPPQLPPHLAGADPEKAQLIMQVLLGSTEGIVVCTGGTETVGIYECRYLRMLVLYTAYTVYCRYCKLQILKV